MWSAAWSSLNERWEVRKGSRDFVSLVLRFGKGIFGVVECPSRALYSA